MTSPKPIPKHDDPFRRCMALHFAGCIRDEADLNSRLEFVQDDIVTAVDLSMNQCVRPSPNLHRFLQRLPMDDQLNCRAINLSETSVDTTTLEILFKVVRASPSITRLVVSSIRGSVDWTNATAALGRAIEKSCSIAELDISRNDIGEAATGLVASIGKSGSNHLTTLRMFAVGLTDDALPHLSSLASVTDLDVGGNTCDLSSVAWENMAALKFLSLRESAAVGSLSGLIGCPLLHTLDLTNTTLSDAGLHNICALVRKSTSLERLRVCADEMQLTPLVEAITQNSSLSTELNLAESVLTAVSSAADGAEGAGSLWTRFSRRVLKIRNVSLRDCCLGPLHVEELVRSFYELDNSTTATMQLLDLFGNPLGDDGADWAAELLALPCVKSVKFGNNSISDGTPMCEALRARLNTVGPLEAELCGNGARGNHFSRDQLQWLAKVGVKDAAASNTGTFNASAAPFLPVDIAMRPFGQTPP